MVIAITFERRASTRLSSWLKKVRDTDQRSGWMLPHVFDELRHYWNTDKFKAMSEQAKKARDSLKCVSLHTEGAKTVGTITREMGKKMGHTPIEPEVFKRTHVKKKENESNSDVWVEERAKRTFNEFHQKSGRGGTHKGKVYGRDSRNDVRRLQSGLQGVGSSRQAEALDGVQIAAMSAQIHNLHRHLQSRSGEE
ncbi:uncharacterized protein [Solanum tuberosum]|uniref:uncharacterized protein n=1 Tax=Solanum tuberosum TaxID=4113 RepID=UPI00073A0980|nr:PREDICTED: uncharacterized protein LOC107062901 [Solanum tuberosum]